MFKRLFRVSEVPPAAVLWACHTWGPGENPQELEHLGFLIRPPGGAGEHELEPGDKCPLGLVLATWS